MKDIVLEHVNKAFNGKPVLRDFSAVVPAGKITCIMGPSGAGTTTLLRILMGLEMADSGTIKGLERIKKSAVFQEDRLCEFLTSCANIRLTNPKVSESDVFLAMEGVGLGGSENQACSELSGGMRRRVALLRALMADYDVLFLDEPFKGLDEETKRLVISDTMARCAGKTVLLVTHAPEEAADIGAEDMIYLPGE